MHFDNSNVNRQLFGLKLVIMMMLALIVRCKADRKKATTCELILFSYKLYLHHVTLLATGMRFSTKNDE